MSYVVNHHMQTAEQHWQSCAFCFCFYFSRKLMNIAFVDMNPFPMRQIQNRRSFHLEKVRLELTELEAIRQTFLRDRETRQDGRSFVSDDEEDNWPEACHVSIPWGWTGISFPQEFVWVGLRTRAGTINFLNIFSEISLKDQNFTSLIGFLSVFLPFFW